MWFFGQKSNPRLSRRVSDHDERLDTLERKLRSLDMEWSEFYDKTRHMMGRIAKRSAIVERAQQQEAEEGTELTPDPEAASTAVDGDLVGLTPRQRQLNQQILASRRRQ